MPAWVLRERLTFERGFPARLETTAKRFIKGADGLMRSAPIQHLTLTHAGRCLDEVTACPHLARLRSLDLQDRGEDLTTVVSSSHLGGLTRLGLRGKRAGVEGAVRVAHTATLARLRHLDLSGNRVYDRGTEAIAASGHLANLESLNLSNGLVGPRGALALATSGTLAGLRELALAGNRIGDRGAEVLAQSPRLKGLVRLDVSDNQMTTAGGRALLTSTALSSLTRLNLRGAALDEDFWAIVPAPQMHGTLYLTVSHNYSQRPALVESPLLAHCAGLALFGAGQWSLDLGVLLRSSALANLRELQLRIVLVPAAVRALAGSPHLGRLRRLSLVDVYLSQEATNTLLEAPWLGQLTHLALSYVRLDQLDELARCPALENILELRLVGPPHGNSLHRRRALEERFGTRVVFG
jgi:hypothetical protein